jgi:hypothetical protein
MSKFDYKKYLKENILLKEFDYQEIKVGDKVTFRSGGEEMEVIDSREMFGSKLKAFRVKMDDGEVAEYSSDQLKLAPDFSPEHGAVEDEYGDDAAMDDEYEKTLDPDYDKADEDEDAYERRLKAVDSVFGGVNEANIGLADIKQMGNKEGFAALGKTIPKFNFQNVPDTEAFVEGFVEGVSQYGSKFMKAKFDDSMFEALNMSNLPEVERIVNILKQADLDGETLQYVLEKIGMDEQMWKQLNVTYGDQMELEEALNPEVQRTVNNLIKAMAKKYGYEEKDAVFAIQAALKQREFEDKKPFNK